MAGNPTEQDLKRFDDVTSTFEKTGLVLGFVNLFLAIWARAPALQINPGSAVGLAVGGFNVGFAIVYGPLIATMTLAVYMSLLSRRHLLRQCVLAASAADSDPGFLSSGDRLALDNFNEVAAGRTGLFADRGWRALWYFIVPPGAAFILLRRFCDFVPNEAAKAWSLMERIEFLFFSPAGWGIQPLLPDRALEGETNLMNQLPYIYAPLQSWIELGLFLLSCWLAWHAGRLYFTSGVGWKATRTEPS